MSRLFARLLAISAVAGVMVALGLATPAYAEDPVRVRIGNLNSQVFPGRPETFTVRLSNHTEQDLIARVAFTVRLEGLGGNDVRMTGQFGRELERQDLGGGAVRLISLGNRLAPDGEGRDNVNLFFTMQFADSAPGGRAQLVAEAFVNGQIVGRDEDDMQVRGGQVTRTPTTAPPTSAANQSPEPTTPEPTFAAVNDQPLSAATDSGRPTMLYVLGALLVVAGGIMLWLLLRRPRGAALVAGPAGPPPQPGPSRLTHPVFPPPGGAGLPRRPTPPTAVMPAVNPPYDPQHAVDPWAGKDDL